MLEKALASADRLIGLNSFPILSIRANGLLPEVLDVGFTESLCVEDGKDHFYEIKGLSGIK